MKNLFRLSAAITKIDDETRTIEGVATAEVVDKQGEVVDYETAKSVIAGTWPGNLREMHKPEAVGTGVVVECDDATKSIRIRGHVSKGAPLTWEKVKDGTLKMFSIGGSAKERRVEKIGDQVVKRLFLGACTEISLVDNGACPTAGFAIVKIAGGKAEPVADDTVIAKSTGHPETYDIMQAAALVAALNELLASEIWSANDEGTPEALAQVEMLKGAIQLLLQFLQSEFAEQFAAAQPGEGGVVVPVVVVDSADVAMARMATIAKSAMALVAKAGARHSKGDMEKIQAVHDHSTALGATCPPPKDEADAEKVVKAIGAAGFKVSDIAALQVLDREGKPIGERIVVTTLGEPAPAVPAPAAPGGTPAPVDPAVVVKLADLPEVQKLVADLRAENDAQKATLTAQAATIADVTKRLEKMEQSPAPGGPVRVVEKTIAGQPAGSGASDALTPDVLEQVIKQMPEGQQKDILLVELQKMNRRAGVGITRLDGVTG